MMRRRMASRAAGCSILLFACTLGASAATFQDGMAAFRMKDYRKAAAIWTPLAERGDANAQGSLGALYLEGLGVPKNYQVAIMWLTRAADMGNGTGEADLAECYVHGVGVPVDYAKAAVLSLRAARKGIAIAQQQLGYLYANGRGVTKDLQRGYVWTVLAAQKNNAAAQYNLPTFRKQMSSDELIKADKLLQRCSSDLKACN